MKILVAYASRHGATQGIAERIAATLERNDLAVTFKPVDEVHGIDEFDAYVIGSSVYMFHWEKDAADFVRRHAVHLAHHPVWLFCSGPVGTEMVDKEGRDVLESARPKEFEEFAELIHPRAEQVFFGVYDPFRKDATLAERIVTKMPAIREALPAGDFREWPVIEGWAEKIATELQRVPVTV
jgi:menaquinone-dependent protoporphyrinogen oxidase